MVSYVADAMTKKIQDKEIRKAIEAKQLLLLSDTNPDTGFTVAKAMNRNKYIYASSCGAIAVAADLKKGGTWTGAIENLNHNWVSLGVWDTELYSGNKELILRGAVAIDQLSEFSLQKFVEGTLNRIHEKKPYQITLFENKVSEAPSQYSKEIEAEQLTSYNIMIPYLLEYLTEEKNN